MTAAAADLLNRLAGINVTVNADAGGLRLRPASAVPANWWAEIKAEKAEILRIVSAPRSPDRVVPLAEGGEAREFGAACDARAAGLTGASEAEDVLADRAAAVACDACPTPPPPGPPPAELVDRLARALATPRPWERVTDAERARAYFEAEAVRRLWPLDPLARGLLVQADEARARRLPGGRP